MSPATAETLQSSDDRDQLQAAALSLAVSKQDSDHAALLGHLKSEEFLIRLDTEEDYAETGRRLHVESVLSALHDSDLASAHRVLFGLTQNDVFLGSCRRTDALIQASSAVRPPPPELLEFWDRHSAPLDGYTPITIEALVENGHPSALGLIERKMADPRHEAGEKIGWMRGPILTHRNDLHLLESCDRMLRGNLPDELRPELVAVLFDYRGDEWFAPLPRYPDPPERAEASPQSRAQLRQIGEYSLKSVPLSRPQRDPVRQTLREV